MTPTRPRRRPKPGKTIVLDHVDWGTYEKLVEAFGDRREPRLVYDRGTLQIMAPSNEHEFEAEALGQVVRELAEGYGVPIVAGGQTTLKSRTARRGLEPDRCYWLANAHRMAGVRRLDLTVHPPPDLAIEMNVSGSPLNKLRVFAGLGVPELWRHDREELAFHRLGPDGRYAVVPESPAFPGVTPADLMTYLKQGRGAADQTVASLAFRAWVRQRVAAQAVPPPPP